MRGKEAPDWVAKLGATACDPTPAKWEGWEARVRTYCFTRDAVRPRRNQLEWREHWPDEYGKPLLKSGRRSERTVAEFEVVAAFRAAEWSAKWQDSFGAAPDWMKMWTGAEVPTSVSRLVEAIRRESPRAKPWDVLAWQARKVMFVECKAPGERFTESERAFIWAAHRHRVALNRFAVARVTINYPSR